MRVNVQKEEKIIKLKQGVLTLRGNFSQEIENSITESGKDISIQKYLQK